MAYRSGKPTGRPPIEQRNPELLARIGESYARTGNIARTAKELALGARAVRAALIRNPATAAQAKAELAAKMLTVADLATTQAEKQLPNANARDSAIVAGIMVQRAQELTGDAPVPTVNVAVLQQRLADADAIDMELKRRGLK